MGKRDAANRFQHLLIPFSGKTAAVPEGGGLGGFVGQTPAGNPLTFVLTVWPYYSRVGIKDLGGFDAKL